MTRKPVEVSVIIPTFNRSEMVIEAIDSVREQTFQHFEIIVVDDGSTDDTPEKLLRFGPAIRYVRQANQGVNAARNVGISLASGRYIALLDDDDLWMDWKLEAQVDLLEREPDVGFVFSDFYIKQELGAPRPRGLHSWYPAPPDWNAVMNTSFHSEGWLPHERSAQQFRYYRGDIYRASLSNPYVLPSTAIIRRERLDSDLSLNEADPTCGDWEFFAVLSKRHGALFMDVETAYNRSHEGATRLTRLPRTLQLSRRLGMLHRVWRSDARFLELYQDEVHRVEHELLRVLAYGLAIDGDDAEARRTLRERLKLRHRDGLKDRILTSTIRLPMGPMLLRLLHRARAQLSD